MAFHGESSMPSQKKVNVVVLVMIIAIAVIALLVEIVIVKYGSLEAMVYPSGHPSSAVKQKSEDPRIANWAPSPTGGVATVAVGPSGSDQSGPATGYLVDLNAGAHAKPKCFSTQVDDGVMASWNPQGTTAAYQNSDGKVYCYSYATARTDAIAESGGNPEWVLDGESIVLCRGSSDSHHGTQFKVAGIGRTRSVKRLHDYPLISTGHYVWNAKEQKLACTLGDPAKQSSGLSVGLHSDLYLVDLRNDRLKRVTDAGAVDSYSCPTWSSDGRRIAYMTSVPIYSKQHRPIGLDDSLVVYDLTSGKWQALVPRSGSGEGRYRLSHLRWSPDGRHILALGYQPMAGKTDDMFTLEWPSGALSQLTSDGKSSMAYWSSDGKAIMYVRGGREIWQMNFDGTNARRLWSLSSLPKRTHVTTRP